MVYHHGAPLLGSILGEGTVTVVVAGRLVGRAHHSEVSQAQLTIALTAYS